MVLTVRFYTKKYDFFIKKTQNRGLSLFFHNFNCVYPVKSNYKVSVSSVDDTHT